MSSLLMVDMGSVWGGQEVYSRSITSSLVATGWHVTCVSSHERHEVPGSTFRACSISYRNFPFTKRFIDSMVADHDVVHFNGVRAIYLSALIAKSRPFVGTKHALYAGANVNSLKNGLAHFGSRWVFNNLDWLISISDSIFEELPHKVRQRSSVVLNGVADIGKQSNPIDNVGHLKICFVGRFVESKGVMRLLRAFARLRDAKVDIELILAGNGPLESEARKFVLDHKLDDCVTFAGYVENPGDVYNQCHICVLPSLYEGLPLSLLEAMSASCALVAHDIPGVRAVLKHEVNGVFTEATDESLAYTLQRLAGDRRLLAALRTQARRDYLEHWQIDRMVNETESIYRRVISQANSGVVT